jgi:uncharacterized protein (UPF0218 family)
MFRRLMRHLQGELYRMLKTSYTVRLQIEYVPTVGDYTTLHYTTLHYTT